MRRLIANLLDAGKHQGRNAHRRRPSHPAYAALVDQARTTFATGGGRNPILIDLPHSTSRGQWPIANASCRCSATCSRTPRETRQPSVTDHGSKAAPQGAFIAISVSDEGRGITPDAASAPLPQAAGNGRRQRTRTARSPRGLVEAHGGRIRAESGGEWASAHASRSRCRLREAPVPEGGTRRTGGSARIRAGPWQEDARPGGRRRSRDAALREGRPVRCGLRARSFRPIRKNCPRIIRAESPEACAPRSDAPRHRRDQTDAGRFPSLKNIPVIFISAYGRDETDRPGARERGRPTTSSSRSHRPNSWPASGAALRDRSEPETFAPRRPRHRLRIPTGPSGRSQDAPADGHRVRPSAGPVAQRRALSCPHTSCSVRCGAHFNTDNADPRAVCRQEAPQKARGRRRPTGLYPQRAWCRLPNARAGRGLAALSGGTTDSAVTKLAGNPSPQ